VEAQALDRALGEVKWEFHTNNAMSSYYGVHGNLQGCCLKLQQIAACQKNKILGSVLSVNGKLTFP